jgi:hypothetical protein
MAGSWGQGRVEASQVESKMGWVIFIGPSMGTSEEEDEGRVEKERGRLQGSMNGLGVTQVLGPMGGEVVRVRWGRGACMYMDMGVMGMG